MNRRLKRRVLSAFALVTFGLAVPMGACTVNVDRRGDAQERADTTTVEATRASALVLGRLDANVTADVRVVVNGTPREVSVGPDRTFVVRDVPHGKLSLLCESDGLRGEFTIESVVQGEMLEISVRREGNALVVNMVGRLELSEAPREVVATSGEALAIRANNVCYYLRPGTYERDVHVLGNNVKLLGASRAGCADERSILAGTLIVRGNNATIFDVELGGRAIITGNNVRIHDPCSDYFSDGKQCAKRGCDACLGDEKECRPHPDAPDGKGPHAPAEDAGPEPPDSGTGDDAGSRADADPGDAESSGGDAEDEP